MSILLRHPLCRRCRRAALHRPRPAGRGNKQTMASTRTRSSGLFSGLVLISVALILLLHNYRHLELQRFFTHWWPLLIIFWGVVILYERTAGRRFGSSGVGITAGEVFLVLGMIALLGIVVAYEYIETRFPIPQGDTYSFDLYVAPKTIPAKAPVLVRTVRGDITVRGSDESQIRITAKKNVRTWNEEDAGRIAKPISVEISKNGDAYEVQPSGIDRPDARIGVDMEVSVPKQSTLTVKTEKGDVEVSDMAAGVVVGNQSGDVAVRSTGGDVAVEMRDGDAKINDTKGDVKISGKGGEIEVVGAKGSLTVDGDFYGPVRADNVLKGVHLVSAKADLTLSSLTGHMEAGPGNLSLIGASGNVNLRARDTEINVENPGGKVNIDNRNANINVRFSSAPKADVLITNSSSSISLSLPGSSSFEIQADCRDCDVDSEFPGLGPVKAPSGDASLAGKYGSGKGPKITLKTSYGNIALRRTSIALMAPATPPRPIPLNAPPTAPIPPATEQ